MTKVLEGRPRGQSRRLGVVAGRFNEMITKQLLDGCLRELVRHGVAEEDVTVAWVPGAFEIPIVAARMAECGAYDAVICLGAVIRGATPHFDYVAAEATKGVAMAALRTGRPVLFGILTTDTIEQAIERAGTKAGNKGRDVAISALEMIDLLEQLPSSSGNPG